MSAAAPQAGQSAVAPHLEPDFLEHLLDTIVEAIPAGDLPTPARITIRNAARLALLALQPADAFQAMLAAQAVATHYAIMDAFRRANDAQLTPAMAARQRGNAATLSRTMQATLRTLRQLQAAPPAPAEPRARPAPGPEAPTAPNEPRVGLGNPGRPDMTLPQRRIGSNGNGSGADHAAATPAPVRQGASAPA